MTLGAVAGIVGGRLADADAETIVSGPVEFDSRRAVAGGLFLALPGEHVDGHDFTADAVRAGALACLVTRPVDSPRIEVTDGLDALTALATVAARRLPATVVSITGSSGKTSTKDLAAHVLAQAGRTVAPRGSYNNELGFPYTVLQADERTRFLVLEASARGRGHIRHLTRIAAPGIAVVLNVGSAHLGEFGSRAAIAEAKAELVEALGPDGVAVLNADDEQVLAMAARTRGRVVTVGESASAQVRAERVTLDSGGRASFDLVTPAGRAQVGLLLVGRHQVGNALAVAAVALTVGMPLSEVAAALGTARPASRWRMEVHERGDGVTVINDAYNANPESMRAALAALAQVAQARGARAVAVLGTMAELGEEGPSAHREVGRLVAEAGVAHLIAVGAAAHAIADGAEASSNWAGHAERVADADAGLAALRGISRPGDVVLVKASRAASLDRVAAAMVDDAPDDPAPDQPAAQQAEEQA